MFIIKLKQKQSKSSRMMYCPIFVEGSLLYCLYLPSGVDQVDLSIQLPNQLQNGKQTLSSQQHRHVSSKEPVFAINDQMEQYENKIKRQTVQPSLLIKTQAYTSANESVCKKGRKKHHLIQKQIKMDFRMEWRNQNRNIIPNIMNQLMSFLLKPIKSSKVVTRTFQHLSHPEKWTVKKYFQYLKIIKEKISHYLNQENLLSFFHIQDPHSEVYNIEQQQFYMKISRIIIYHFLTNESILISLTSTRMNIHNRRIHLAGRLALLRKFQEMAQQARR